MPVRKRFWEKPEQSPSHIGGFKIHEWRTHDTRTLPRALSILSKGILSPYFSKKVAPSSYEGSVSKKHSVVFLDDPKSFLPKTGTVGPYGDIRFLISNDGNLVNKRLPKQAIGNIYDKAAYRVAPRHIGAIIVPEYHVKSADLLEVAKENGVPVYSREGKRIWPPVE